MYGYVSTTICTKVYPIYIYMYAYMRYMYILLYTHSCMCICTIGVYVDGSVAVVDWQAMTQSRCARAYAWNRTPRERCCFWQQEGRRDVGTDTTEREGRRAQKERGREGEKGKRRNKKELLFRPSMTSELDFAEIHGQTNAHSQRHTRPEIEKRTQRRTESHRQRQRYTETGLSGTDLEQISSL